jgi:hypothetical protein
MKNFILFGVKSLILILLSFSFHSVSAIGELNLTDARSFALGNLQSLSQGFINPAHFSFQTQAQLGVSVLNRFEMKELNTTYLQGTYPNKYIDAGLAFSHYGYEDYQIIQTQVGLAKKILPELSIGINLVYFHETSILAEDEINHLSSDIGIYYQLNETIELALLMNNVLHTFDEKLEKISGGISYEALENCFLLAEANYDASKKLNFSLGIEYELLQQFDLRAGIHAASQTPSFGIAYQWNHWTIDTGFALHPTLGLSSIIGFNYHF